ncbi:flagellar basal-body MS-ring/collar protein FliF [Gorillibacterium sp. CAU 1737]|uniref:flagellar basal-body MS-ring/collar protein FliF n=1 Tax=Gorillibacterium sp. CAU 1737 TaxID=3140362 RepID=UPI00326114A7
MNETIRRYWDGAKERWLRFGKSQKIAFVSILLILLISVPMLIMYFSRTEYSLAFTDLQPNDAAAIKNYLDSSSIPYQLSDDGKNISVPRNKAATIKIDVVQQGLNQNGAIGYESLKDSAFGTTDREFDVKQLSMLQGEVEKMLNTFDAVARSNVMINLPKESVFLTDSEKEASTAAVILTLKPGYLLDQQKIDTMYQLVSHSVKNLPVGNVTISEANGDLLPFSKSDEATASATTAASVQFQIKKQFERDIQANVTKILSEVIGSEGKVVPIVVASLNFDKKTSEENLVTPVVDNEGIAISVQEIQESYSSDGSSASGAAGTGETDVPTYPSDTNSGKTTSEKVQKTINNEVNRIHNVIEKSPYYINDLSISVGIETPNGQPLSDDLRTNIQKLLKSVVSASLANRENASALTDDDLTAKVTVFENNSTATTATAASNGLNWYLIGGIGAAVLALAGLGGFLLARRRRNNALVEEFEPAPTRVEYPTIDLDAETGETQMRKQLEMLAKKKPDEFVNLLRTWLVDE